MKYIKIIIFMLAICLLSACSDEAVEMVKNSNFPEDNSITIGQLLDSSFDNVNWKSKKNDRGQLFVTFTGTISKSLHERIYPRFTRNLNLRSSSNQDTDNLLISCSEELNKTIFDFQKLNINKQADIDEFQRICASYTTNSKNRDKEFIYAKAIRTFREKVMHEYIWPIGKQVYVTWLISSNHKSIKVESFGGEALPAGLPFYFFKMTLLL